MMWGKGMKIDNFCVPIAKNCSDEYKKMLISPCAALKENNKAFINR
jgi:hypothetical protein